MKSKSEENVKKQLLLDNIAYTYETLELWYPKKVTLPVVQGKIGLNPDDWERAKGPFHVLHKYTPDFIIEKRDGGTMVVEVKGQFAGPDRQKIRQVKKYYIDNGMDFRMVFDRSKSKFSKDNAKTYGEFCQQLGIPYADKAIPQEWLEEMRRK